MIFILANKQERRLPKEWVCEHLVLEKTVEKWLYMCSECGLVFTVEKQE